MINRTGTTLDASEIPYDSLRTVIIQLDDEGGGLLHLPCTRCEGSYYQDFGSVDEVRSLTISALLTQFCPDCADIGDEDDDDEDD